MGNNQEIQHDISSVGAEKRVYRRDPIYLHAVIKSGRSRTRSCKIRNYCAGGMFLTFDDLPSDKVAYAYLPQHDDIVNIECHISTSRNVVPIYFHGRIVRVNGNNAGLAFINPDLANIVILNEISQAAQDSLDARSTTLPTTVSTTVKKDHMRVGVEQTQPTVSQVATPDKPTEQRQVNKVQKAQFEKVAIIESAAVEQATSLKDDDLIGLCNQIYIGSALRYLDLFLKEIDQYLFQAAKDEHNANKQNEYFSDRDKIDGESKNLRQSFFQSIKTHIDDYTPDQSLHKMQTQENLEDKFITLSLVEDEAFDEWLADTVAIDHIETCYRQELIALDRRLTEIWCKRIHKDNNVYGPYILSHTFHEVIKQAKLKHHTNIICYKLFENVLLKHLGDLYGELNQFLVSKGVVPDIHYSVKIEKQPDSSSKAESLSQVEQQDSVKPEQAAQSNVEVAQLSVDASMNENRIEHKLEPGQIGIDEAIVLQKKIQQAPIKHDEIAMQDLYQIVGELRELQQAIKSQSVRNDTGQSSAADSAPSGSGLQAGMVGQDESSMPACSPEELVGIIAQLQPKIDEPIAIDETPDIFKSRVMAKLANNDGEHATKRIGQRENRIIDVAGYLFHSIMNDQQVAEGVRSWIKRLEVPVLKIAIVDDSLFLDRSHIVRQVINKIADLELLSKEGGEGQQFIVRKAIDWLISLINTEFDGSSEVFTRADKQLTLLLDIQTRSFKENVKRVIDTSKLEEQDLSKTPDDHPIQVIESEYEEDEQTKQWTKKVQRLQEGAWFVFDLKQDNPFRLRLAWIAPNTKRFVFVTVNGKKDRVLHSDELITRLRDGEAVILDNASESVMDRAQFSMLQDLHKKLIHQTTHDQLTGLMGRREFEKRLDQAVNQAKCTEKRCVLFFMDLDQFQVINNACGYEGGDTLLVEVAGVLQSFTGEKGVLARVGSDEFALLLNDRGLEDALDDAEHIIHALAEHRFAWQGDTYTTTISMGLVPVTKVWEESSALLQAAESSCGLAKDIGGNRVQLYHTAHDRLTRKNKHIKWISEIEHVLGNDKMELRCQKIAPVNADSGFRDHYEILLVVRDDDGNNISIQEFIEAAEWYNRIGEIDRWVIHHSFNWIADNPTILNNIDGFSINLSGRSLNDETLMGYIEDQFRQSGVPPEKVCFEVTETAGVSNLSDAAHFIECIKETGCKFSLDDFGSGMSSYAYLKNLPIDYLKIDGCFVKDMVNNANDTAVVKSICEIGHFMGKKIIAECVENEETRLSLTAIGVDYVQGYGIEKPILLADLYV